MPYDLERQRTLQRRGQQGRMNPARNPSGRMGPGPLAPGTPSPAMGVLPMSTPGPGTPAGPLLKPMAAPIAPPMSSPMGPPPAMAAPPSREALRNQRMNTGWQQSLAQQGGMGYGGPGAMGGPVARPFDFSSLMHEQGGIVGPRRPALDALRNSGG